MIMSHSTNLLTLLFLSISYITHGAAPEKPLMQLFHLGTFPIFNPQTGREIPGYQRSVYHRCETIDKSAEYLRTIPSAKVVVVRRSDKSTVDDASTISVYPDPGIGRFLDYFHSKVKKTTQDSMRMVLHYMQGIEDPEDIALAKLTFIHILKMDEDTDKARAESARDAALATYAQDAARAKSAQNKALGKLQLTRAESARDAALATYTQANLARGSEYLISLEKQQSAASFLYETLINTSPDTRSQQQAALAKKRAEGINEVLKIIYTSCGSVQCESPKQSQHVAKIGQALVAHITTGVLLPRISAAKAAEAAARAAKAPELH